MHIDAIEIVAVGQTGNKHLILLNIMYVLLGNIYSRKKSNQFFHQLRKLNMKVKLVKDFNFLNL